MAPYDNSLWFIETNTHPLLSAASAAAAGTRHARPELVNYIKPSFWRRFKELQRVMWATNAGLTERHAYDSRPSTWPVLRRGINFWTKDHRQIYLIGNPVIWYASLGAIFAYAGARVLLMLRAKRGKRDFQDSTIVFYDQAAGFLALGWAMHFLPFFAMSRQLFIHHYLPALYFSILLVAVLFDLLTAGLRPKFRLFAAIGFVGIAFISYTTYAPLSYATPWTQGACERSRLLKTWDFNCRDFPHSYAEYSAFGPGVHTAPGLLPTQAADVEASESVAEPINEAQAGNHPFENVPKQAAHSGRPQGDIAIGQDGGGIFRPGAEDPMARPPPGSPGDVAAQGQVADAGAGAGAGAGAADANQASSSIPADAAASGEGLDQEGLEAIVMGGTADSKPPARSIVPLDAARESVAAVRDDQAAPFAPSDDGSVHVEHDT